MADLLSNASATGSAVTWAGGSGVVSVVGTFSGATVKMQYLGPDGVTYIDVPSCSFTANGLARFTLPAGKIQGVVSGGPPSAVYMVADALRDGS
jgi:hypothetical protein